MDACLARRDDDEDRGGGEAVVQGRFVAVLWLWRKGSELALLSLAVSWGESGGVGGYGNGLY